MGFIIGKGLRQHQSATKQQNNCNKTSTEEAEFKGKAYTLDSRRYYRGKMRKRRIKREKINDAYVYRKALSKLWNELESDVTKNEKNR